MAIARINEFTAADGNGEELHQLLESFADQIRGSSGCLSVSVLRSQEDANRNVVYEVWDSVDDHQTAASVIPADAVDTVVAMLSGPPIGEYFDLS
ncbi:MAG: putative quinol monooxygenase [Candidatus Nanopelagicales bacterium]